MRGLWPSHWLTALAILIAVVGGWEVFWRVHDFEPTLSDDPALWARTRERANERARDAVVLVGSSRMQMDIQQEPFARATGWAEPLQLALVRGPSAPVLEHLAEDERFVGVAIVEINPVLFFAHTPNIDRMLEEHIATFESLTPGARFEQRLAMVFQSHFLTRLPDLGYEPLKRAWKHGRYPLPSYNATVSEDRFRAGDYLKIPNLRNANAANARLMRSTTPRVLTPYQLAERLREVDGHVRAIRVRGGDVIFVHLPSSLHVLEYEKRWWKRADTWDELVEATDAWTVHYLDHPTLRSFDPPDGDHLGRNAAEFFSERFGDVLVELGAAPGPRG